ncbi:MAG TPA: hypothetical protein VG328_09025 [Stellaceae bacterium]|nr:hypothetical protein [Stellaceae bacterium]
MRQGAGLYDHAGGAEVVDLAEERAIGRVQRLVQMFLARETIGDN